MVVPHRPALFTAKMLATMDLLSNGRICLGVGAGWLREEFEALETRPFDARGQVTDEFIAAMQALWTEAAPQYQGEHVKFGNITFLPKPVQQPHMPIWVGGESGPGTAPHRALRRCLVSGCRQPQIPPRYAGAAQGRARQKLHEFAEKAGRDPASIETAYLWFHPVSFTPQPGYDTPRRMFSGSAADMAQRRRGAERGRRQRTSI